MAAALILAVVYLARSRAPDGVPGPIEPPTPSTAPSVRPERTPPNASTPVTDAFHSRRSNVEVQTAGRVVRLLPDDARARGMNAS